MSGGFGVAGLSVVSALSSMSAATAPGVTVPGSTLDPVAAAKAMEIAQALRNMLGGGGVGASGSSAGVNFKARCYIGSVPLEITEEQLRAIFAAFGPIKSCELLPPLEATSGHAHRGYGFLEFEVRLLRLRAFCERGRGVV
jgi:hypothetical protein